MANDLIGNLDELSGDSPCACGRSHILLTRRILTGSGVIKETGRAVRETGLSGKALVVADRNTWKAAGEETVLSLTASGIGVDVFVFPDGDLHTDEHAVGSVFMALADGTSFLVAVGSGTINDCCRFVAKRAGVPYMVVGTAPSMDGYASDVSPIVRGGFKTTYRGVAPLVIIGDMDVLKDSPLNMMAAGLGDVFGKITALLDWQMAERLLGEYRCLRVATVMQQAVDACMGAASGLPARDAKSVEDLMKGLVLAGLAMQMVGDSRPASGCEHHVSHFLEMRDLYRGRGSTLHGDKVGMAELIMLRFYEKFFEANSLAKYPVKSKASRISAMKDSLGGFADVLASQDCSAIYDDEALRERVLAGAAADWAFWQAEARKLPVLRKAGEASIRRTGGPVRPSELAYSREDIYLALKYAMELRDKFTVLRLADLCGRLDSLAGEIADEFC